MIRYRIESRSSGDEDLAGARARRDRVIAAGGVFHDQAVPGVDGDILVQVEGLGTGGRVVEVRGVLGDRTRVAAVGDPVFGSRPVGVCPAAVPFSNGI